MINKETVRHAAHCYAVQANASAYSGDYLLREMFDLSAEELIDCFDDTPPYWRNDHMSAALPLGTHPNRAARLAYEALFPTVGPLFEDLRSPAPGPGPQFPHVPKCPADLTYGLHDWMLVGTRTLCTRCREQHDTVRESAEPPVVLQRIRYVCIVLASTPREQHPAPQEMAAGAGVPLWRLSGALEEFAFTYPEARRPHPETWQWGPGARCVFCCAPSCREDLRMCAWHRKEQERLGILGDWQYHRLCIDGQDKHAPLDARDVGGVPHCPRCLKSLAHIPPASVTKHRLRQRAAAAGRKHSEALRHSRK